MENPFEQFISRVLLFSLSNGGKQIIPDNDSYEPETDYTNMNIKQFISENGNRLKEYCKDHYIQYNNFYLKIKKSYEGFHDETESNIDLAVFRCNLWYNSQIYNMFIIYKCIDDSDFKKEFFNDFFELFNPTFFE